MEVDALNNVWSLDRSEMILGFTEKNVLLTYWAKRKTGTLICRSKEAGGEKWIINTTAQFFCRRTLTNVLWCF
jgi:hypothetical protein